MTGTPFGRYRLIRLLARGGMAEVYLASLSGAGGFEKRVALKKILPIYSDLDDFAQLFQDEARICSALDHTNIVQVFDYGEVGGDHYIAMEFVDGPDLEKVLVGARKLDHRLSIDTVLYIGVRVAAALDHAHRQVDERGRPMHLVHRDVSPGNVLLSVTGDVKITDFGVARFADKAVRSQAGVVRGKYAYMSPEQVQGADVDQRSDLFALGIVLYEMIASVNPFAGATDFQTMEQIVAGRYRPVHELRPDVPRDLSRIVARLLQTRRDDRTPDADTVRRELASLMFSRGVIDDPSLLVEELFRLFPKQLQRRGVASRPSISSVALPAVGAPRMRGGDPDEGPRPTRAAPAARRRPTLLGPDDGGTPEDPYDDDDLTQPQLGNPDAIPTQGVGTDDEQPARSISDPFAPSAPRLRRDAPRFSTEVVPSAAAAARTIEDIETGPQPAVPVEEVAAAAQQRAAPAPVVGSATEGVDSRSNDHLESLDLDLVSGSVPSVSEAPGFHDTWASVGPLAEPPQELAAEAQTALPSPETPTLGQLPALSAGTPLASAPTPTLTSPADLAPAPQIAASDEQRAGDPAPVAASDPPLSAQARDLLSAMEDSFSSAPKDAADPADFGGLDPPSAIGLAAIRLGNAAPQRAEGTPILLEPALSAGGDRPRIAPSPAAATPASSAAAAVEPTTQRAGESAPSSAENAASPAPVALAMAPAWAIETTHPAGKHGPETTEAPAPVSTHGPTLEYPSATPVHAPLSVGSGLPAVVVPDPLPLSAADVPAPGSVTGDGLVFEPTNTAPSGETDTAASLAAIGTPKRRKKKKRKDAGVPWLWIIGALAAVVVLLALLRVREQPVAPPRTALSEPTKGREAVAARAKQGGAETKAPPSAPAGAPVGAATEATSDGATPATGAASGPPGVGSSAPGAARSGATDPSRAPSPTPTPPGPGKARPAATAAAEGSGAPRTGGATTTTPTRSTAATGVAITLRSDPSGAALTVNGKGVGKAPWTGSAPTGSIIEVTARLAGHLSTTRMLRVSDRPMEASVQLTPITVADGEGTVQVSSDPWGYVFVDGKETGKVTPVRLTLSAGPHEIRIENPELNWADKRTVIVELGKQVELQAKK